MKKTNILLVVLVLVPFSGQGQGYIDGAGTAGKIPFFQDNNTIQNSELKWDAGNSQLKLNNYLSFQWAYHSNNSGTRLLLSSNIYWDNATSKWKVGWMGANDFKAITFNNTGSGISFYAHTGDYTTGVGYDINPADLAQYERMRINSDGNVGIGVVPSSRLDVKLKNDSDFFKLRRATGTGRAQINLADQNGAELWRFGLTESGSTDFSVNDGTKNVFRINKSGNVIFDPVGRVAIGTVTSNKNLFVYGTVQAREVYVTTTGTDWPDYVFSSDYDLTPLSQLAGFISQNGHLPDVPSAEEVAENGVELGEMNKILLKKVEELTLHLINQEKRIAELEAQVKKSK